MNIRFDNLPSLLKDMRKKDWIIDAFSFMYKKERYIVILKTYKDTEVKPNEYAIVKLEFIRSTNILESIHAYADFYEVHFKSVREFVDFFKIEKGNANRNLFVDFSVVFASFIPKEKVEMKDDALIRKLQATRCESNKPNAIFCQDVRRNGKKSDGSPSERSIENSNKAKTLRPYLYEKFKDDKNLSFYFSEHPEDELDDREIIARVAARNS